MKATKVHWTPFALSRLDEIYDYILKESKSHSIAVKFTKKVFEKTDRLVSFPESGQVEELLKAIGQKSRYLVVNSYKVIYEYHPHELTVIITDVFHAKQNPKKLLKPRSH